MTGFAGEGYGWNLEAEERLRTSCAEHGSYYADRLQAAHALHNLAIDMEDADIAARNWRRWCRRAGMEWTDYRIRVWL
ncbi:MAG: hypothetical protein AAB834_06350 [Patescibacteria group bacterium]